MKRFILNSMVITMILFISGCNLFRKVNKSRESDLFKLTAEYSGDSAKTVTDRSVLVIKEKVDTLVLIPEQLIRQENSFGMDSLVNGITAIKNDLVDVRLILNPVTQRLLAEAILKPRKIPVRIEKETVIHKDIKVQSDQTEHSRIQVKDEKTKVLTEKTPVNLQYWFAALLVAIAAVIFVLRLGNIRRI